MKLLGRITSSNFGEQLDEVIRPSLNLRFWGVSQSIKPCLKLVEEEHGGMCLEHLKEQIAARHISLGITLAQPLAFGELTLGVPIKEDVPQKLESLLVETLGNHAEIGAKFERLQL